MKLRKSCKVKPGDAEGTTPTTPQKTGLDTRKASTGKRKGKKAASEMLDPDNDDTPTDDESPTKKIKTEGSETVIDEEIKEDLV